MSSHRSERVRQAFVALSDALVSWERDTGRGSKLFYIPDEDDEKILFLMDGKPVSHGPTILISQLELIIERLKK